jgi:CheY-like chemotaxis protein
LKIIKGVAVGERENDASILVVEDEAIVALDVATQLQLLGYRVAAVVDEASAALAEASRLRPDLVLMDIALRGKGDGITLAEELYVCEGLPVVFLTAHTETELLSRARCTGAYGFVTKPFSAGGLRSAIELALAKHRELITWRSPGTLRAGMLERLDASIVSAPGGEVRSISREAVALLGTDADLCLGRSIGEVLGGHDAGQRNLVQYLREACSSHRPARGELRHGEGGLEVEVVALGGGQGGHLWTLAACR